MVQPSLKFRNTICHGDLWSSNILFDLQGNNYENCRIIDFQSYRYLPPAHDLLAFLYFCTDRSFRSSYLGEMINLYYLELKNCLNTYKINIGEILPHKDYVQSCRVYEEFAIVQTNTHFSSIMLTPIQLKELFSDAEYNKKIFFEDRSDLIIKTCKEDEVYKFRLLEALLDLKELFL